MVTDPGPDPDDVKALLVAAMAHKRGEIRLQAVICNGSHEPEVRAILAKKVLNHIGLSKIEVIVGEKGPFREHRPHELSLEGDASASELSSRTFQQCMESLPDKSCALVIISGMMDVSSCIQKDYKLLARKVISVGIMGGMVWGDNGWVADTSVNNTFSMDSANLVYNYFISNKISMKVTSRTSVPLIPMQLAKSFANRTECPIMKYLAVAQSEGLVDLWHTLCSGGLPERCTKSWYFETFCGYTQEMAMEEGVEGMEESIDIRELLAGYVKPYDVVALMTVLPHSRSNFANDLQVSSALDPSIVLEELRRTYQAISSVTVTNVAMKPKSPRVPRKTSITHRLFEAGMSRVTKVSRVIALVGSCMFVCGSVFSLYGSALCKSMWQDHEVCAFMANTSLLLSRPLILMALQPFPGFFRSTIAAQTIWTPVAISECIFQMCLMLKYEIFEEAGWKCISINGVQFFRVIMTGAMMCTVILPPFMTTLERRQLMMWRSHCAQIMANSAYVVMRSCGTIMGLVYGCVGSLVTLLMARDTSKDYLFTKLSSLFDVDLPALQPLVGPSAHIKVIPECCTLVFKWTEQARARFEFGNMHSTEMGTPEKFVVYGKSDKNASLLRQLEADNQKLYIDEVCYDPSIDTANRLRMLLEAINDCDEIIILATDELLKDKIAVLCLYAWACIKPLDSVTKIGETDTFDTFSVDYLVAHPNPEVDRIVSKVLYNEDTETKIWKYADKRTYRPVRKTGKSPFMLDSLRS